MLLDQIANSFLRHLLNCARVLPNGALRLLPTHLHHYMVRWSSRRNSWIDQFDFSLREDYRTVRWAADYHSNSASSFCAEPDGYEIHREIQTNVGGNSFTLPLLRVQSFQ